MAIHPREPSRPRGAGQGKPARGPAEHTVQDQAGPVGVERVARALARAGVASRRDAERLIEAGRVAMNGQVLTSPAVNVGPDDILTLDGVPIAEPEPVRVWRYHKPTGLLTTHKDPKGRPTVFDTLPKEMGRVISVGRLDLNSEGVMLLTNDGALARALELPSSGWVRRYRARAFGRVTQEKLDALKAGVTVEGVNYGAIEATLEKGGGGSNIWINVAITEGKNREVRRVLEYLSLKVNRLIRVAYGPFELGDLEPGAVAEAPPRIIREQLAGAVEPARMPKGDRKLFNWSPGRRFGATLVAGRGRVGGPEPADDADGEAPRLMAAPARAPAPERKDGPRGPRNSAAQDGTARAGRSKAGGSGKTAGEAKLKPTYKAGWARPKSKPVAAKRPAPSRNKPRAPKP